MCAASPKFGSRLGIGRNARLQRHLKIKTNRGEESSTRVAIGRSLVTIEEVCEENRSHMTFDVTVRISDCILGN
jgi:hypothetical protein